MRPSLVNISLLLRPKSKSSQTRQAGKHQVIFAHPCTLRFRLGRRLRQSQHDPVRTHSTKLLGKHSVISHDVHQLLSSMHRVFHCPRINLLSFSTHRQNARAAPPRILEGMPYGMSLVTSFKLASMTGTPINRKRRLHSSLCCAVTFTVRLLYLATSASDAPVCSRSSDHAFTSTYAPRAGACNARPGKADLFCLIKQVRGIVSSNRSVSHDKS